MNTFKTLFAAFACTLTTQALAANSITVLDRKLSPNWAHEYMGSDLVREEIKVYPTSKVNVAIFDSGFEQDYVTLTEEIRVPRKRNGNRFMRANHGTAVANLFNGPAPYGTTDNLNLINLTAVTYQSKYSYAFHHFDKEQRFPKIISNSLGWKSEKVPELAQLAHEKNILWFLASGNSWPEPVKELEVSSKALLVGSFSPSGLTSFETQSDERLLVLAASNEELPSINGKGEPFLFGATSGATPIVAATVTNMASLLPQITRAQVFKIIQTTALPSMENKLGDKNQPGLLNAYKAFRVSAKISKRCPPSSDNETCITQALLEPGLFNFSSELFTCEQFLQTPKGKAKAYLAAMRRSALLGNQDQLTELACAYKVLGFDKNVEFYEFLASKIPNLPLMQEQATKAIHAGKFQISYYRYLNLFSPEVLKEITQSENLSDHHKGTLRALY